MAGIRDIVDGVYREQSRRVFATLVRLFGGDFDLAEEAMHDAFAAAVEQWATAGVPDNPRAWLVSAGRFRGIDAVRRRVRHNASLEDIARRQNAAQDAQQSAVETDTGDVEDDRLRLIFTCCHPSLASATQVALTLREVCGLTTEEVASAFLTAPATIAQRIVRGKAKIRDAGIPYQVPALADLPDRLESVLSVIYLVFNEGYAASSGESLTRSDLSGEAIRLGRLLSDLLQDAEVLGLTALMLLQESRRKARATAAGDIILLEEQDRSLWDQALIAEGKSLVNRALGLPPFGAYTIQAAIVAVHADALESSATDWPRIAAWYDLLARATPSPVVELNRAVAIAMRDGPEAGLPLIDALLASGQLTDYHLAHAARADLCRRLGRLPEARVAYERALELARLEPERRFLQRRLRELAKK